MIMNKPASICKHCGEGNRIISISMYSDDKFANLNESKCGTCVIKDMEDTILENAPNSIRANEIIMERQKKLETKMRTDELNHFFGILGVEEKEKKKGRK